MLEAFKAAGLDRNTLTVFFSDNGPRANAEARSFQETERRCGTSGGPACCGAEGHHLGGEACASRGLCAGLTAFRRRVRRRWLPSWISFPTFVHAAGGRIL